MNKHITVLLSLSLLAAALQAPVSSLASGDCNGQYGQYGGQPCPDEISIDKKVKNPVTGVFMENLLSGDTSYSPGSEVTYTVAVSNTSDRNFSVVTVTDTLPTKLINAKVSDETENKAKVYDESYSNGVLTFKLQGGLDSGETVTVFVKTMVKDASVFTPSTQGQFCEDLQNHVKAETAGVEPDTDTAKICVTTKVLGETKLPEAGVSDYLPLLPFLTMGMGGIALFRKKK